MASCESWTGRARHSVRAVGERKAARRGLTRPTSPFKYAFFRSMADETLQLEIITVIESLN